MTVGSRQATLLDAVLCGVHSGSWQQLERETREGLALEALGAPSTEVIRRELTTYRYAHKLISADDFRGWLTTRSLELSDIESYVGREWLRHQASDSPYEQSPIDVDQLMVDALCSGTLHRCATELSRQLIADPLAGDSTALCDEVETWLAETPLRTAVPAADLLASARRVAGSAAAYERLRAELATPRALQECVTGNAEGWVRFGLDLLRFAAAGPAREARLLLLDGEPPGTLLPHATSREAAEVFLEDAGQALQVALLRNHDPGDVLCWPGSGCWQVATVLRRRVPALEDPVIAARAGMRILDHELTRRGAGKVAIDAAL